MERYKAKKHKTRLGKECWKIEEESMINVGDEFVDGAKIYRVTDVVFPPSSQYPWSIVDGEFVRMLEVEEISGPKDLQVSLGRDTGSTLAYLRGEIKLISDWARLVRNDSWDKSKDKQPIPARLGLLVPKVREKLDKHNAEFPDNVASRLWGAYYEAKQEAEEALQGYFNTEGDEEVPF